MILLTTPQEVATWVSVGIALLTVLVGIMVVVYRISSHLTRADARGEAIVEHLEQINGSLSGAHERIDSHLEQHIEANLN